MIAAIYARKSTDQNVSDDEKSVARQVERARAYAERKAWTVAEEHVYVDDGISGAEYLKRPGYLALMNALGRRAPFQVLVVMEQSRLGRSLDEVPYALKRIGDAAVQVFCYLTDTEIKRETLVDQFTNHTMAFVDVMHREQSRQRTRDAMRRQAERGHVAGGLVYGYVNHEITHLGRDGQPARNYVELRIYEAQAAVVRRIFAEIAAGRGFISIAKGLTADGIPAPRAHRGWAGSGVREMVFRGLYRGHVTYGKTRREDRNGTTIKVKVPESDWITREDPALRIVDEGLWQAAHARLGRTRATYLRGPKGRLWSRPESGLEAGAPGLPKYLLAGFLECVVCHGGMHATKRTSQRGAPAYYYVCREHRNRAYVCVEHRVQNCPCRGRLPSVANLCANSLSAPMADLHGDLIAKLKSDVLSPKVLGAVLDRALELERSPEAPDRRARLADELARLEREIARYTDAIAQGGSLPSILAALHEREGRRQEIQAQLEHQDGLGLAVRAFDSKAVRRELRDLLTDWQGLLEGEPAQARQILRKLLEGRVVMQPHVNGRERTYEWTVTATYGRILTGVVGVTAVVPPG